MLNGLRFQIYHSIPTINSKTWFSTSPIWALDQWFSFACKVLLFFVLPRTEGLQLFLPFSHTHSHLSPILIYLPISPSLDSHNSNWKFPPKPATSRVSRNIYGMEQHHSVMRQHFSLLKIEMLGCLRTQQKLQMIVQILTSHEFCVILPFMCGNQILLGSPSDTRYLCFFLALIFFDTPSVVMWLCHTQARKHIFVEICVFLQGIIPSRFPGCHGSSLEGKCSFITTLLCFLSLFHSLILSFRVVALVRYNRCKVCVSGAIFNDINSHIEGKQALKSTGVLQNHLRVTRRNSSSQVQE